MRYAGRVDLNTGFWERGHGKSSRRVAGLDPSDRRTGARTSVLVCHYGDEKAALARVPEQRLAQWPRGMRLGQGARKRLHPSRLGLDKIATRRACDVEEHEGGGPGSRLGANLLSREARPF